MMLSLLSRSFSIVDTKAFVTRSLFFSASAVCGIGSPSGWRNKAVTANQSASPPTSPASKPL
ncbi:hypothetical protein RAC89_13975 [Paenibacillus sp. GD4]|nr:hypothetical protein [Paenibacillus sp. GD4]MDQ1911536.1 hypothetical protein [Paenibacillus sp. GD4]